MSVPVVFLGPEQAFRLGEFAVDGADVTGAMPTGPWLADRHGTPLTGSLGVLVDNVVGYALVQARAAGRWSVSSEISIDLVRPFDLDAGPLLATTVGALRLDDLGGHASGTVTVADGEVVAVCAQRGRWVPFDGEFALREPPAVDLSRATCVEDLVGADPEPVEGGARVRLVVSPALQNPLGNLHGGVSLCASDLAASAAVRSWDDPWVTESLRIHYPRPVLGGADVEFTATVRHAGRTRAVVDVEGTVGGRLCTHATIAGRPATKD